MDVTIIIATYGNNSWIDLAQMYSVDPIVSRHSETPIVRLHGGGTLAESRNAAAALAKTEWLCFVDADDYIDFNYFEEMEKADSDLRVPRLLFNSADGWYEPYKLNRRNIEHGNPCPIGTLIRKEMFDRVGGFWEEPVYEDWSLFRRAHLLGASIQHTQARYFAHNLGGRNSSTDDPMGEIEKIKSSHERWLKTL